MRVWIHRPVARAALRVEESEQLLQRGRVGAVADERAFALSEYKLVVLQLFEMVRQRGARDAGLDLDLADDEPVGMGGQQESHDAQPGLCAERGEHVRVFGDVSDTHSVFLQVQKYDVKVLELWLLGAGTTREW